MEAELEALVRQARRRPPLERTLALRGVVLCATGLRGKERRLMRELCSALGVAYSGDLVPRYSTHLLEARPTPPGAAPSAKAAAAAAWGLPVLTLRWLLDSVREGALLPARGRYLAGAPAEAEPAAAAKPAPPPPLEPRPAAAAPAAGPPPQPPQQQVPAQPVRRKSSVASTAPRAAATCPAAVGGAAASPAAERSPPAAAERSPPAAAAPGEPARDAAGAALASALRQMSISPLPPSSGGGDDENGGDATPSSLSLSLRGLALPSPLPPLPGDGGRGTASPSGGDGDGADSWGQPMSAASSPEADAAPSTAPEAGGAGGGAAPSPMQDSPPAALLEPAADQEEVPSPEAASPPATQPPPPPAAAAGGSAATAPAAESPASSISGGSDGGPAPDAAQRAAAAPPPPRRRPAIPTGLTQHAGPLVVARPRSQQQRPLEALAPAPGSGPGGGSGVVCVAPLARAPRGCAAREAHGLKTARGVLWAEAVLLPGLEAPLSCRGGRAAVRLRLPPPGDVGDEDGEEEPAEVLGEPTVFYRLPEPDGRWFVEYRRLFTAAQAAAAAAAAGAPRLRLPPAFDAPGGEVLRGRTRRHAPLADVAGAAPLARVAPGAGGGRGTALRLRQQGGAEEEPSYFYRWGLDCGTGRAVPVEEG